MLDASSTSALSSKYSVLSSYFWLKTSAIAISDFDGALKSICSLIEGGSRSLPTSAGAGFS